jgi:hypothetical protein
MTIDIRIANLAVNLNCNILADKEGDICLLQKFYNDKGIKVERSDIYLYNCYTQEDWIKAIEQGEAYKLMC